MAFFAASCTVTIDFKLADIKLESSEVIMKLEKNLSQDFNKVISFFGENVVSNKCQYLTHFYTHKKIYNIFLKFHHSSLRMPKIKDIG